MDEAPQARTVYTTTAAGQVLGYSDEHIRRLCEAGQFPGAFRRGASGHWRVPESAIEAFREANKPKVRRRA